MSDTPAAANSSLPAPLVAIAGWVLPGLGYWLIGHRARAIACCLAILALFLIGILVAGIRVIDVPGYAEDGQPVMVAVRSDGAGNAAEFRSTQPNGRWVATDPQAKWVLRAHPIAELLNKPWYIGQIFAGPITLVCSKYSVDLSRPATADDPSSAGAAKAHVRIAEIGTLYTAVAGMLNLLVMIDAAHRASQRKAATP